MQAGRWYLSVLPQGGKGEGNTCTQTHAHTNTHTHTLWLILDNIIYRISLLRVGYSVKLYDDTLLVTVIMDRIYTLGMPPVSMALTGVRKT